MTKCYISGKIDGDDNYMQKFAEAEELCLKQFDVVINPVKWDTDLNKPWIWYICRDIWRLWFGKFTHIVMLDDWEDSAGASIELLVAVKKGIEIVRIKEIKIKTGGL